MIPFIKIKKDTCTECNGLGKKYLYNIQTSKMTTPECERCKGFGELDWCRKLILGVKE